MTDTVSSESAEQTLKNNGAPEGTLDVKGRLAGQGVKYDVPHGVQIPVQGENITVTAKLDKKSVENAKKKVGLAPDDNKLGQKNNKKQDPLIPATENSAAPRPTVSDPSKAGNKTNSITSPAAKGPSVAASNQRHNYSALKIGSPRAKKMRVMLKLRETFDKIAKRPERKFTVKFVNLSLDAQIKLIESALEKKLDRIATGEPVAEAIKRLGAKGTPRLVETLKKKKKANMSPLAKTFERYDNLGMLMGGFIRGPSIYD